MFPEAFKSIYILKLGKHLSIFGECISWICYSRIAVLIVGLQWDLDMLSMELVSRDLSFKSIIHSSYILWSDYVSNWTTLKNVPRQPWKMCQVGQPWKNVFNHYYYNNHLMFVKNFDVAMARRRPEWWYCSWMSNTPFPAKIKFQIQLRSPLTSLASEHLVWDLAQMSTIIFMIFWAVKRVTNISGVCWTSKDNKLSSRSRSLVLIIRLRSWVVSHKLRMSTSKLCNLLLNPVKTFEEEYVVE